MSDTNTLESKQNVPREADVSADVKLYVNETASESNAKVNSETTPSGFDADEMKKKSEKALMHYMRDDERTALGPPGPGSCYEHGFEDGYREAFANQETPQDLGFDGRWVLKETLKRLYQIWNDAKLEQTNIHGAAGEAMQMIQAYLDQDTGAETSPSNLQTELETQEPAKLMNVYEAQLAGDEAGRKMQERIAELEAKIVEYESDPIDWKKTAKRIEVENKALWDERHEFQDRIRELEAELSQIRNKLELCQRRNTELEAKLWVANDSRLRTYDGMAQKADRVAELESEVERLKTKTQFINEQTDLAIALEKKLAVATEALEEAAEYANTDDINGYAGTAAKDALAKIKQE